MVDVVVVVGRTRRKLRLRVLAVVAVSLLLWIMMWMVVGEEDHSCWKRERDSYPAPLLYY